MTIDDASVIRTGIIAQNADGTPTREQVESDVRNARRIVDHLRRRGQYPCDFAAIPKYMAGIKAAEQWKTERL